MDFPVLDWDARLHRPFQDERLFLVYLPVPFGLVSLESVDLFTHLETRLSALNTCIGSSGTRASADGLCNSGVTPCMHLEIFYCAAQYLLTLIEALLGVLFLGLIKLLLWCLPGRLSRFGRLLKLPVAPVP